MAEATQDAAKPARKKNAHYDVYRRLDVVHIDGLDEAWEPVSVDLAAPSRREAIAKATAQMSEEDQYGTFLVIRSGEAKVLTRAKKTIVADDWGSA